MKKIMVTGIGEPKDSLRVLEVPTPKPKAGDVRIRMLAAPIHPADLLVMRGRHVFDHRACDWPGGCSVSLGSHPFSVHQSQSLWHSIVAG